MGPFYVLEISRQQVPLTEPELTGNRVASRPLFELEEYAPRPGLYFDFKTVLYPISNDESSAYFDQVQVRTLTGEYQQATNRTAVVVGESSLMAALSFISEDTIIMVDKSREMCEFLGIYINALRTAETAESWGEMMGFSVYGQNPGLNRVAWRLRSQVNEWAETGYPHPMFDPEAYSRAHQLVKQKAIVPWCADIASVSDMNKLGDTLRSHNANVTLMNLTNVLCGDESYRNAADYARVLQNLPVTAHAPILATSIINVPSQNVHDAASIVEATGPFFGLENLARHGGSTWQPNPGSAVKRQYIERPTIPRQVWTLGSLSLSSLDVETDGGITIISTPGSRIIVSGSVVRIPLERSDIDRPERGEE